MFHQKRKSLPKHGNNKVDEQEISEQNIYARNNNNTPLWLFVVLVWTTGLAWAARLVGTYFSFETTQFSYTFYKLMKSTNSVKYQLKA